MMKQQLLMPFLTGLFIAMAGTVVMLILLGLELLGPNSVGNDSLIYGGTILFVSLYLFLLIGLFINLSKIKKLNGHLLTFFEALKSGFYVSLSTAIFSVVFTIVFYELIYPGYNLEMGEAISTKLSSTQVDSEDVKAKLAEQTRYYSTSVQAKFSFIGNLLTGLAFTVLLGLFLKTKRKK